MKKLIVSCDDLGISEEVNLGIYDCLEKGVATSSSIIANGRFYEHALNNVINQTTNKFYVLLIEDSKEESYLAYMEKENMIEVCRLDSDRALAKVEERRTEQNEPTPSRKI